MAPIYGVEHCLGLIPTEEHYGELKKIYLRDVHKIFPVMDLETLDKPDDTVPKSLPRQAICLAAAVHPDAKPFLTLASISAVPLTYPEFTQQLSSAMRTIVNNGLVKDRVQVIPVLVILSLCTYSTEDRHLSAELAALAVSYSQTIGLHLQTPASSQNPDYLERLFCCVWAMDPLTAAFHGRPILIHERDIERDLQACFDRQEGSFRLLLEVVALLDGVIRFYRPTTGSSETEAARETPRFEALVEKAGAHPVES